MKSDLRMPESGTSPSPLRPEDPPHGDNQPAKQPEACFMSFSSISIHNVILTIFLPLTVYPLKAISTFM